jgi:hypothetical protein
MTAWELLLILLGAWGGSLLTGVALIIVSINNQIEPPVPPPEHGSMARPRQKDGARGRAATF